MERAFVFNTAALEPFLRLLRTGQPAVLSTLGDSNTCNHLFTASAKGWPELIQTQLRIHYENQQVTLVNTGICGNTTGHLLERLERDVIRYTPACTIITIGTNDTKAMSADSFEKNLTAIVDLVMAVGSVVVLRTPTPIMEREPAPSHIWTNDPASHEFAARIRKLAELRGLPCHDTLGEWTHLEAAGALQMGELMHDEVHPNARGHRRIARSLATLFGMPPRLYCDPAPSPLV